MRRFILTILVICFPQNARASDWSWDPGQHRRCVRLGDDQHGWLGPFLDTTDCSVVGPHYWFLSTGLPSPSPNDPQDPRLAYRTVSDSTSSFVSNWVLDTRVVHGDDWNYLWMLDYPEFGGSTSSLNLGAPAYYYADIFGSLELASTSPASVGNGARVTTEFVAKAHDWDGNLRSWILGIDCAQAGWGDARPDSALYVNTPPFNEFNVYFVHMNGDALGLDCRSRWANINNLNIAALFRKASSDNPATFPEPNPGGWAAATFHGYYVGVEGSGYIRAEISTKNRGVTTDKRPGSRDGEDIGVFDPATARFRLRNSLSGGASDLAFQYGSPGDIPISGDWDGDGIDTVGVFRKGAFYLRNSNSSGYADVIISLGQAGDTPVAGDWNGDGRTDVGVFRQGHWILRKASGAVKEFDYGAPGMTPIVGDWTGQGYDSVGVRSVDWMYLRNSNTTGYADISFLYGTSGMLPFAGDWNGDGRTTTGLFENGVFYLRNRNSSGYSDIDFSFGSSGSIPLSGDWDGLPSVVKR